MGNSYVKKIYDNIKNRVKTELTCDSCELVLSLAHISVFSVSELNYLMSKICQSFEFEDKRVCEGMSDLFASQLYYIFRHTNQSRSEICAKLIGPKCLSDPCALRRQWSIKLENKPTFLNENKETNDKNNFSQNKRTETQSILHLSDLHIDPYYDLQSSSDCGEPLCCRATSAKGKTNAGRWGSYGSCDSPEYTIKKLLFNINTTLSNKYQYIIWTGDIVAHDVWNTTKETIINGSVSLTSMINKYISNGKHVFPVIGNHEGLPVNQFSPPEISGNLSIGWLYTSLLAEWSDWIPKQYVNTFKSYGYYANNVSPRLKFIILNTNYCARLNFWLMYNSNDPGYQLQWLANELSIAEQSQQSVHIVGHIPPDNSQCISQWVHNYLQIIERYKHIIKGQYFGHTHFDEFRVLYSPSNNSIPVGTAYLAPSVTTYEKVNPSYRLYSIDNEGNVLDFENYYMNLTKANENDSESTLKWIHEYSAKQSYNMSSLAPTEWHSVFEKMKRNDNLFQSYYNHYHRYSDAFTEKCSEDMKRQILESIPVFDPLLCTK